MTGRDPGQTTQSIDFSLVSGGSISGRVTRESDGSPVVSADVWADTYDCCGGGNGARTDADGNYTIDGLASGDYRVQVRADEHGLVGELYPSTTDWALASAVPVTAASTTPNIDFTLAGGGSISGRVTRASDGTPIVDANVYAFGPNGWGDARTDGNGDYRIDGLATGDFRVEADAADRGFVREFYAEPEGTTDYDAATLVNVTAGSDEPNIDFALDQGGSILGTVYDSDGVTPLGEVDVSAFSETGGGGHTRSRPDGSYIIEGLASGSFRVRAEAPDRGYASQFYSSTAAYSEATLVPVIVGSETAGIDFVLLAGGSIAGTVLTANPGDPIAGVDVWANSYDGEGQGGGTRTDADGNYEITGLAPGDYRVRAQKHEAGLVGEWYDNTTDWGLAARVPVTAGEVTLGIDFDLAGGGTISGTVYMSDGTTPLAGAEVWAEQYDCCGEGGGALTAADGTYTINGLAPLDYRVRAQKQGYTFEYYLSTTSHDLSTPVTVVEGVDQPNIDFTLDPAGTISGIVTDQSTGEPIANANVWADDFDGEGGGNGTRTKSDGTYVIDSLPTGTYRVAAEKDGYVREYWQDTPGHDSSTPVVVTAGSEAGGIDFTLEVGGSISGVVTDQATGQPIANVDVWADTYDCCGGGGGTRSRPDGTYTIDGLATGSYRVRAQKPGYAIEYWEETPYHDTSTPVMVTVPGDTGGIDFTLGPGGSISGIVTDQGTGQPVADADVWADYPEGGGGNGTRSRADGTFTIPSLAPGSYVVGANKQGYVHEFWQETRNYESSTLVTVTAGSDSGGITFTLEIGGSISGLVTDQATGQPIADVDVWVDNLVEGEGGGNGTRSRSDGTYTIEGLASSTYHVIAEKDGYVREHWQETLVYVSSSAVTVTPPSHTTGIDFTLDLPGSVSGTVTNASTTAGIADAFVIAFRADRLRGPGSGRSVTTTAAGTYTITDLAPGEYYVFARASDQGFVWEFWQEALRFDSSTPVVAVTADVDSAGIDFTLELGGSISGTVLESGSGTPIANVVVLAFEDGVGWPAPQEFLVFSGRTNSNGEYFIGGVYPGDYQVVARANIQDYTRQFWDHTTNTASTTSVTVTVGVDQPGIDFDLEPGGSISGAVYRSDGLTPVLGVRVDAVVQATGLTYSRVGTNFDGEYHLGGLPPNTYLIVVREFPGLGLAEEYYDGVADAGSATQIVITGPSDHLIDYDFFLDLAP